MLAISVLLGPFWAGILAALTTVCVQALKKNDPLKILFNVSQETLSVVAAGVVYHFVGGANPPGFFVSGSSAPLNVFVPVDAP